MEGSSQLEISKPPAGRLFSGEGTTRNLSFQSWNVIWSEHFQPTKNDETTRTKHCRINSSVSDYDPLKKEKGKKEHPALSSKNTPHKAFQGPKYDL